MNATAGGREIERLRAALSDIAFFRDGEMVDRQAHLLREKARIALADSMTREAYDAELVDELTELWKHYCDGDLSLGALAQELGEALAANQQPVPVQDPGGQAVSEPDSHELEPVADKIEEVDEVAIQNARQNNPPADSQLARPTMGDHEDEARREAAYGVGE